MKKIVKKIIEIAGKDNVKFNVDLKHYSTYKVSAIAHILIEVYDKDKFIKLLRFACFKRLKYIILGGGSNVLFKSKTLNSIVVHLNDGNLKFFAKNDKNYLYAFAGCKVASIINKCKSKGFSALEWAIGIPASIGGATIMNMGSFGHSMSDIVCSVTFFKDGKVQTLKNKNLFSYRTSLFKLQKCVIIGVVLNLKKCELIILQNQIVQFLNHKSKTQPLDLPSCGSVFKNGDTYRVAQLIQNANLKGYVIGGAMVSDKHSNFIVNYNNATGKDVYNLIKHIKHTIWQKYKVKIVEEVVIY